jgi:dihydrofolate reductase
VHELLPPAALLGDEPSPLQHGDVLLHSREAHRVGLRESRDRGLAGGAPAKDVAAGRVGQGMEQLVDRLVPPPICNHPVVGYHARPRADRRGGFERGGWAIPLFDNEAATFVDQVYQRADAFLFGRKTYDIFAGYWGVMDPSENAIAETLNTKPKYVASSTLTEPEWDDTTVLSDDVAAAVAELKAKPEGELQVHGSGALIRWLLDNDLVDEITLLTYPGRTGR